MTKKKKISWSIISCSEIELFLGYFYFGRIYIKEVVGNLGSSICHPWVVFQALESSKQVTMVAA
jgi:hypothetical protein